MTSADLPKNPLRSTLGRIRDGVVRPACQSLGIGAFSSVALDYLDLQCVRLLGHRRGGVFVEAGANDGLCQSNTYYLEKVLGWSGVLVEPIPELAAKCTKRRPRSTVVNAALVRHDYPEETVVLEQAGLMSVVNDGVLQAAAVEEHVRQGLDIQKLSQCGPLTVPARTLQDILDSRQISHVDFMSLDVEGYESEVLRGISFDRTSFGLILVEVRDSNETEIDHLLETHGYRWDRIWRTPAYANKLYKRQDSHV